MGVKTGDDLQAISEKVAQVMYKYADLVKVSLVEVLGQMGEDLKGLEGYLGDNWALNIDIDINLVAREPMVAWSIAMDSDVDVKDIVNVVEIEAQKIVVDLAVKELYRLTGG